MKHRRLRNNNRTDCESYRGSEKESFCFVFFNSSLPVLRSACNLWAVDMIRKTYVAVCLVVILVMDCSSSEKSARVNSTEQTAKSEGIVAIEGGGSLPVAVDKVHGGLVKAPSDLQEAINRTASESPAEPQKKGKSHPRKGVEWDSRPESSTVSTSTSVKPIANETVAPPNNSTRKRKPMYTMVLSDSESTDDSFIESSTTGKDFVFPIVLAILVFPLLLLIIKFIYKRGTEFSERQQYRRMYLIDGMYNSR